ncbi:Starch-binding associating with outer membrane [Porphyromonadaceae bacterium KHP3R9]|nr:Starch-binding associating with outer membrane [Porphyromonadaceae bacterium KHP3R9]
MDRFKLLSILLSVILLPIVLSSCKDFLNIDNYFDDEFKVDSIFTQTRYVEAYMWGAAAMFSDEGQIFSTSGQDALGPLATDEAFTMFNVDGSSSYSGMRFVLGYITPDNLGPFGTNYKNLYKIIRKCNTILARIDEVPEMSASDRINILGYTRFIRAYAYNKLLMEFGPPIILGDKVIETNEPIEYYDRPRSTYDEAVEYICSEFEKAAEYMPVTVPILDFGRPTRGAAHALVSRLRLQHASPLYNGGQAARTYFGDWKRSTDGASYVSQTYDESRWALAAAAAKRVIDMELAGGPLYKLYTVEADEQTPSLPENVADPSYWEKFPAGAGGIDHYKSYSEMFNGECVPSVNPEFIWARKSDGLKSYTRASFPIVHGGWGGMAVPQKVIDAYYMQDGRTIDNSSDAYPYSEEGFTSGIRSFSGYRLNAGVYNMYVNREMRFYASIGFSEAYWPCTSASSAGDYNLTVTYYYDSPNGKSNPNALVNHTPTGYVIKKYIHPMDAWSGTNARVVDKVFPIIRYAEILLNYAEALNNLTTTHTVELNGETYTFSRDVNEIANAFNQVRYRAGLPGLSDAELQSQEKIQELLEKERMIEFLFENRRFYDVRRWGIYEDVENERITGMNVDANKEGYYQRVIPNTARIGSRIVNKRMVFLPLPRAEIRRLPSLDQNPGW